MNVSSPLIKHQLHQAYSDLVRREHVRKYPRFYILCIDIERLTTSEISLLIKTYKNVFCYLFQRRSEEFPEEPQIYENLLLPFQTLRKFYDRKVKYRLVFQVLWILQNTSPFWAGSQADITNEYEEAVEQTRRKAALRPYTSEFFLRRITNYI